MRRYITVVLCLAVISLIFPAGGWCLDVGVSGRVSSKYILRDTSGFQYGFLDDTEGVQWRNEIKVDVTLKPEYVGRPNFRLEQVFLIYRGAYDAIFECRRDEYNQIREKSIADYELGKDDLEWENDLREAFVDLVGEYGMHKAVFRLGRQIVQWGEADGFNLLNVVCPSDFAWKMAFSDIDDLATPLWMARVNYTVAGVGIFDTLGLEAMAIPDIRPTRFAPTGGKDGYTNFDAPYAFPFAAMKYPLSAFGAAFGIPDSVAQMFKTRRAEEVVPARTFDNMEYGIALYMGIGEVNVSLNYFVGYQDYPAADMSELVDSVANYFFGGTIEPFDILFRHPRQRTIGGSFNYFFAPGNFVFRGETSYTDAFTTTDQTNFTNALATRNLYQALVGIDKELHPKWIGTTSALTSSFQLYYRALEDWQDYRKRTTTLNAEKDDHFRITAMLLTDYYNGRIKPQIFAMYDPAGTWMTNASLAYDPDGKWLFKIEQMSFWGNKDAISPFAATIGVSELACSATYRF